MELIISFPTITCIQTKISLRQFIPKILTVGDELSRRVGISPWFSEVDTVWLRYQRPISPDRQTAFESLVPKRLSLVSCGE